MMTPARKTSSSKKTRDQLLEETLPQIEQFIESRESYIKALELAVEALKRENSKYNKNNLAIRSSIDELVAMQRLSNTISTAVEPELIISTLIELTQQVIPVTESNVFLFDHSSGKLFPLSSKHSSRLEEEAQKELEAGIVDWVLAEKKTVIIPDLEHMLANSNEGNFVIVPLILRNEGIGIYLIHTSKPQPEFSNQDIQLLSILANQAAAGVENWRTHEQLKKAHEELKSSQAQMIQAAKLAVIGELAANIVHEIKNPVQILMMHVDLLRRGKSLPNEREVLAQQVTRLSEITRRLMNFSRSVPEELPMELVDVNKALMDMVAIVEREFKNEKINITAALCDSLPPVLGNSNYLQQVFLNLLLNARDAMPTGGLIKVSTEKRGSHVAIHLKDTGLGIPKEDLDKIFKPFFTTKEKGNGAGLGLSICSKIITQHGGQIKVESEVGRGTCFTILLLVKGKPGVQKI